MDPVSEYFTKDAPTSVGMLVDHLQAERDRLSGGLKRAESPEDLIAAEGYVLGLTFAIQQATGLMMHNTAARGGIALEDAVDATQH